VITAIAEKEVGRSVLRVEIGIWILVLAQALIKAVGAEVDVEQAVAIVVGHGCAGEGALRRACELKGVRLQFEGSIAAIGEEQRPAGADDNQVLAARVGEVGEDRTGGAIEHADSGLFGHIGECAVPAVLVEPVGQAGRLADIDVVQAIAVEVANRDAVVAVDVDAACAVKDGAPVIDAVEHLLAIGDVLAQRRGGYIHKTLSGETATHLSLGGPGGDRPLAVGALPPAHVPLAGALLAAVCIQMAGQIVVQVRTDFEGRLGKDVDHIDLHLDNIEAIPRGQIAFQGGEELLAGHRCGRREGSSLGFEGGAGA